MVLNYSDSGQYLERILYSKYTRCKSDFDPWMDAVDAGTSESPETVNIVNECLRAATLILITNLGRATYLANIEHCHSTNPVQSVLYEGARA